MVSFVPLFVLRRLLCLWRKKLYILEGTMLAERMMVLGTSHGVALAAMLGVSCAFADENPYADYVTLTKADTWDFTSWESAGNWSDGLAPHSDTNYYVAADRLLYRANSNQENDNASIWQGGKLVLAGTMHIAATAGNQNSVRIDDLVLLGGSHVRTETYGPFFPRGGVTGSVEVASTIDNPALISHHYPTSLTGGGYARNHSPLAYFKGTADAALTYTRPFVAYNNKICDYGFFVELHNFAFSQFGGTLNIDGGNTIAKPTSSAAYNFPNTALCVKNGAHCWFYVNNTLNNATANAYLRSLDFSSGTILVNASKDNSQGTLFPIYSLFPVINVKERFAADEESSIIVKNLAADMIKGITTDNDAGHILKIATLDATAEVDAESIGKVKIEGDNSGDLGRFFALSLKDNGASGKDIYLSAPGIVVMTNHNVETTSGSSIAYGAFEDGHASDWSNNETPAADSALHYWGYRKICFFETTERPNATLTFASNSSWKDGSDLKFKEVNLLQGKQFGLWGGNANRKLTADKLNIVRAYDNSSDPAIIYVFQNHTFTINAEIAGSAPLLLRNKDDSGATFVLPHLNTNFNGKLTLAQLFPTNLAYQAKLKITDARNLGGPYTQSANCFDAVEFLNNPMLMVEEDAAFTEPTRGFYIKNGACFQVKAGKKLTLANQVTYEGLLQKTGDGMLELSGVSRFVDGNESTAPVAESNKLHIAAGSLKVSSKTAADGLSVSFAEGTKLVVPAVSEGGYYNVKWQNPLVVNTEDGKLPVKIELEGDEVPAHLEVPICTFSPEAAANIPVEMFKVGRPASDCIVKSVVKTTNADGNIVYIAKIGKLGTQIIVR